MDVMGKVIHALREFFGSDDVYLLQVEANERSITHRFANYIEREFPDFDVDCEFNRTGIDPKRLDTFRKRIESDDAKGTTVFPDIIVHHRGTTANYLVIEAKTSANETPCTRPAFCSCDRCKLRAYKRDLGYQHAYYVTFPVREKLSGLSASSIPALVEEING